MRSFQVLDSEGIATDMEFIQAYVEGKTVLSNGIEFTHDHLVHIFNEITSRGKSDLQSQRGHVASLIDPLMRLHRRIVQEVERGPPQRKLSAKIQKDLDQLSTIYAIWIDGNWPTWDPVSDFIEDMIEILRAFSDPLEDDEQGIDIHLAAQRFSKTYPDLPLTEKRADYLSLLLRILLYPEIVKTEEGPLIKRVWEDIKGALKCVDVVWREDVKSLSFIPSADSSPDRREISLDSHPIEVVGLVRTLLLR